MPSIFPRIDPRRFLLFVVVASLTLTSGIPLEAHPTPTLSATDVKATHEALFETLFPFETLPLDPELKGIARALREGLWQGIQSSPSTLATLHGLTHPAYLLPNLPPPVRKYFEEFDDPAIQKFLEIGFVPLDEEERFRLFEVLLESPFNELRRVVAGLRTLYLTAAYDLYLSEPLTGIDPGPLEVDDPEAWMEEHAPQLPPSALRCNASERHITHTGGTTDYVVVGSGPGGATVAHELRAAGFRVVLVDRGSFVVPDGMDTRRPSELMLSGGNLTTADGGIFIRAGNALGGGSAVNVDLSFSPLEAAAQARIHGWVVDGLVDSRYFSLGRLSEAYTWVRENIGTVHLDETMINRNNQVLWDGSRAFGVEPRLYQLNRNLQATSLLDDKKSAVKQLLLDAMTATSNPLTVIPDAEALEILFEDLGHGEVAVSGIRLQLSEPWNNALVLQDPAEVAACRGEPVTLEAKNVVVAAGSIGSPELLLRTGRTQPALRSPMIGRGPILHPAMPLIGSFREHIGVLEDLRVSVFVDAFGIEPGFILEAMDAFPSYAAVMTPGRGDEVFERVARFQNLAGFGVLLVDTPNDFNRIELDPSTGQARVRYEISTNDKVRFRQGIEIALRLMFLAGAQEVIIPSNENFLRLDDHDPTRGVFLTCEQGKRAYDCAKVAAKVAHNLEIIPNRTIVTSAHMQASNKMGPRPDISAVSWNHRVWNHVTKEEIPNLYVMDSSVFPTSAGVNPMQTIYTVAKIFSDRLIDREGLDPPVDCPVTP